jgi:hypothetical protein
MSKDWGDVSGVDPAKLYQLFQLIDDIGVHHEWNELDGELSIRAGDTWITFTADEQVMADMKFDAYAYADAQGVADTYWRE